MVGVAQLVERRIVIPVVVGSKPIAHPSFKLYSVAMISWFHLHSYLRAVSSTW